VAIVKAEKVAQALNLTESRVHQLVKEGLSKEGRGQYDAVKCMLWYVRYLQNAIEKRAEIVGFAKGIRRALEIEREHANSLRESGVECCGGEQQPVNPKSKKERRAERRAKSKAARLAKKAEKSNDIPWPIQAEMRAST